MQAGISEGQPRRAIGRAGVRIIAAVAAVVVIATVGVAIFREQVAPFRTTVLIVNGSMDPIVPPEVHRKLADTLRGFGADVRYEVLPASHQLTRQDLVIAAEWLGGR